MLKKSLCTIGFAFIVSVCAREKLPPGISVSTDAEEWGTSKTSISVSENGGTLKTVYSIPVPEKKYAYASLGVPLKALPGGKTKSIHFELKCGDGALLPSAIALISSSGKKSKIDFPKIEGQADTWRNFDISLDDFSMTPYDIEGLEKLSFSLGSTRPGGKKLSGTVEIRGVKSSETPVEPIFKVPDYSFLLDKKLKNVPRGHSAWIYPPSENHVKRILEYNKKAEIPIRTLYVYAGSLNFDKASGQWVLSKLQSEKLKWFRERLPESIEIQANIDSTDGVLLSKASPEVQEKLGRELAEKINLCPYVQAVHSDIEPYKTGALPFYIALKKYCKKPVGIALGEWDMHILRVVDYPVLMGYDLSKSPEGLYKSALRKYNSFAKDSSYVGSYCSIGLPFIATVGEFEYEEDRETGKRTYSGYKMNDFIDGAFKAFKECNLLGDKYFTGVSIWGFVNENKKGVGALRKKTGCYPYIVQDDCFEKLRSLKY